MSTHRVAGHRIAARMAPLRAPLLALALAGLAACTPLVSNHGYVPSEEDLAGVIVGVDTRETVADVVGSPSAGGVLDESGFYYVAQTREVRGARAPQITSREVVAIRFDGAGVVSNIERFGLEDGNVVALSRRVTDSNVQGVNFIQQLLGGVGRLAPGALD